MKSSKTFEGSSRPARGRFAEAEIAKILRNWKGGKRTEKLEGREAARSGSSRENFFNGRRTKKGGTSLPSWEKGKGRNRQGERHRKNRLEDVMQILAGFPDEGKKKGFPWWGGISVKKKKPSR